MVNFFDSMLIELITKKCRGLVSHYQGHRSIRPSLKSPECNVRISEALHAKKAYLVGRLGWMEGYVIGKFLSERGVPLGLREKLMQHAGVFPPTTEEIKIFVDTYLAALSEVDLLGLIEAPYHGWLIKKYAKQAKLAALGALEPYFFEDPWSWELRGLKILVIHPFVESIQKQYATVREKIFSNPKMLPDFELKVIKAPQTITGNKTEFESWSEALKNLEEQVSKQNFDVAVIGCGAYGLPLAATIKKMGKIAIHLGGATQLLFGIRGWRWAEHPAFIRYRSIMTEAWSSPLESERPIGWDKIENGCYW